MLTMESLVGALELEPLGDGQYRADNCESGGGVIFGGQLLAQSVIAGLAGEEGKAVKTVHTIFARAGSPEVPVEIAVDRMHSGRAMASCTVTISQGERLCARSLVLLSSDEPDFIRHADPVPLTFGPDESRSAGEESRAWQVRIAGEPTSLIPNAPVHPTSTCGRASLMRRTTLP
jgi:acyl-CoA thioesterase-2